MATGRINGTLIHLGADGHRISRRAMHARLTALLFKCILFWLQTPSFAFILSLFCGASFPGGSCGWCLTLKAIPCEWKGQPSQYEADSICQGHLAARRQETRKRPAPSACIWSLFPSTAHEGSGVSGRPPRNGSQGSGGGGGSRGGEVVSNSPHGLLPKPRPHLRTDCELSYRCRVLGD